MSENLGRLNRLARDEVTGEFLKCCGSTAWASRMANARPFKDMDSLLTEADDIWWSLQSDDWLEAFSHHPKIGEKRAEKQPSSDAAKWSSEEQSGMREASAEIATELAEANRAYAERFGYIFIVCATGKSPSEMLALIKERLHHDPETELRSAAEEQRRITHLRLRKLLEQ